MATVIARDVLARASILLLDGDGVRWPQGELLAWLNDGQREAVIFKPNIFVRNVDVALVTGTKQGLPEDGNSLVDIPRNTDGNVVRVIARNVLDGQVPDWHMQSKAKERVLHYCYSELDPKHFYVYPPSPGGNSVEMIYNAIPPNVAIGAPISIDDIYVGALVDYVIYRAFSKDSEYAPGGNSAAQHYTSFVNAIKGKAGGESATDPNKRGSSIPKPN